MKPDDFLLHRREFLRLGSAAALTLAGSALGGELWAGKLDPVDSNRLSIGFADIPLESEGGEVWPMVDATTLHGGDAAFLRDGARVTVHGFMPAADGPARPLALKALYSVEIEGRREIVPFMAWSHRGHPVAQTSVPVRFVMPVDPEAGMTFEIAPISAVIRFAVNPREPAVALRQGVYVIGILSPHASAADWHSLRLRTAGDRLQLEPRAAHLDSLVVSFAPAA